MLLQQGRDCRAASLVKPLDEWTRSTTLKVDAAKGYLACAVDRKPVTGREVPKEIEQIAAESLFGHDGCQWPPVTHLNLREQDIVGILATKNATCPASLITAGAGCTSVAAIIDGPWAIFVNS